MGQLHTGDSVDFESIMSFGNGLSDTDRPVIETMSSDAVRTTDDREKIIDRAVWTACNVIGNCLLEAITLKSGSGGM